MGSIKPNRLNTQNISKPSAQKTSKPDKTKSNSKANLDWSDLQAKISKRDSNQAFALHMDERLADFDKKFEKYQTPASIAKDYKASR